MKYLIAKGANLNVVNTQGETALYKVSGDDKSGQSTEYAKILISLGVDWHLKNADGLTALEVLKKESAEYNPILIKYLESLK